MKISRSFYKSLFCALFAAVFLAFTADVKAVCTIGSNLILNGDAEADTVLGGSGSDHNLSNWDPEAGTFTAVRYTAGGGFPTVSDPGPASRGNFFFAGGPQNGVTSSGTQIINVADCSADIDANRQPYDVSGFFGGFASQPDTATLTLTFRDGANASLGSTAIGTVTAGDRGNATGLISRAANGVIPAGTRTIEVVLSMPPTAGYNDGYADNLSFVLNTPSAVAASISGRAVTANGNGIGNVNVSLVRANGEVFRAVTGSFGYYRFENLPVGETYILNVASKRFSFPNPTRVITLTDELTNEDFIAAVQ